MSDSISFNFIFKVFFVIICFVFFNLSYSVCGQKKGMNALLLKQEPLIMAACIQLASKMHSNQDMISIVASVRYLESRGVRTANKEMRRVELHVLQMLDYRLPLWTNVEKAEILAHEVGMSGMDLENVGHVVNICDFYRKRLEWLLRRPTHEYNTIASADSDSNSGRVNRKIRTMNLIAGAVTAAAQFRRFTGPDLIPKLAFLTKTSTSYITCIGDIIFSNFLSDSVNIIIKLPSTKINRELKKRPAILKPKTKKLPSR